MSRKVKREVFKGDRFGKLITVEKFNEKDAQGRLRLLWLCQCDCGKTKKIRQNSLGNPTESCGCKRPPKVPSNEHYLWKGVGEISGWYFSSIGNRSNYHNFKMEVTKEYMWELFLKQERKCALTGLPLKFVQSQRDNKNGEQTASIDRIDSTKGYTKDNIQWVHKDVNKMKNAFPQERFIEICKLVAKTSQSPSSS